MVVLPRARLLLAVALAAALGVSLASGCRLDAGGLAAGSANAAVGPDATAPPDGTAPGEPVDASLDSSFPVLDAGSCTATSCAVATPAGWTLVAFAASRDDACPAALTTVDVVEASFQVPGCSCGCTPQTQPNCDTGAVAQKWDNDAQNAACDLGNPAFATAGCNFPGWNLLTGHLQLTAPTPTDGTCTSAATPDTSALQTSDERVCAPSADACAACGSLPSSFQTCALHDGDVACPSAQLPTKHLVGSQANLSCSGSCGSCQLKAASCTGTLTFYTDTQCSAGPTAFTADGTCQPANLDIQRYQWQGAPVGVTCQGSGPPTATLGLSNQATVCCP